MRVETAEEADRDVVEAAVYLERERRGYGARFIDAFEHQRNLIELYPYIGRKEGRVRHRLLVGFKYDVIYAVRKREGVIVILAVAHHSQRPRSWLHRRRR